MQFNNGLQRITLLDALRGCAVIGMIIAHGLFFFHDGSSDLLNTFQRFLNFTVFTLFVFVSGMTASVGFEKFQHTSFVTQIPRLLIKSGKLYGGYCAAALIALITTIPVLSFNALVSQLPATLFLFSLPNFTEYLPFFLLLTLSIIPFYWIYKFSRQSLFLTILFSIIVYLMGLALYSDPFPQLANGLKELFAGSPDTLRFPFLFYLPVFLLGLWWHVQSNIKKKFFVLMATLSVVLVSVFTENYFPVTLLSPFTRWPPSLGYLSIGVCVSIILTFILPYAGRLPVIKFLYQFIANIGIDAFELWIVHLVLLFGYRRFIQTQYGDVFSSFLAILLVFSLSIVISTLFLTKRATVLNVGPLGSAVEGKKKIKKRYIFAAMSIGTLLVIILQIPASSNLYGETMQTEPLTSSMTLSQETTVSLVSTRKWYIRNNSTERNVHLTVTVFDESGKKIAIPPSLVTLVINGNDTPYKPVVIDTFVLEYVIPIDSFKPSKHLLLTRIDAKNRQVVSEEIPIIVSEPLLVAWTLDWEGWDAPANALSSIEEFSKIYDVRFTHFVSPRTFTTDAITSSRKEALAEYLRSRITSGDEVAMHLHMHFDFIRESGVTPRTTRPWGLLTHEGYDVPTSEYSPEEFRKLVQYGRITMRNAGLPTVLGYRAGGWFISTEQLNILEEEGFTYDSSARDKPSTGVFTILPWNIPIDQQPYIPHKENQNMVSPISRTIIEIPNNGGNTYEFSTEDLKNRIQAITHGEQILLKPTVIVVVSHPQFSQREFTKIPEILKSFDQQLAKKDTGPVMYTTMSDIQKLWISQHN